MPRMLPFLFLFLLVMTQPTGAKELGFPCYHARYDISILKGLSPSDTSQLKVKRPKRPKQLNLNFKAYQSIAIKNDSLLKVRSNDPFLWVDSFRNLQHLITQKPLLWSPRALVKSMPESELTNLLADILLFESRQIWDSVDIALLNPGGIRAGFPADTLRVMHIMEVLPFPNRLDKITLSGGALQELLDHWAAKGGAAVSGLSMTIQQGKAMEIQVGNVPLNTNKMYRIALPDYLVDGGDGCSFLVGCSLQRGQFRITDLVIRHLELMGSSGSPLKTHLDGRIRVQ
ncbi:MAG: 5'-nucleotidase [Bacteroidia bacterium]